MKNIDKNSDTPLYYQLMNIIIEQIQNKKYSINDRLPSERELCDYYNISRSTVRQAILELERDGYIYRVHGKGTFISSEKIKQNLLKFYSFTDEMKKIGKKPKSKVLDFEIIKANLKVSRKMNLEIDTKVYRFTRLRIADDEKMMLETTYLPFDKFSNLTREELEKEALYDILRNKYNIDISSAKEIFQAVITNEKEAELLDYSINMPSILIERTAYSNKEIIEYTKSIARGDTFKYSVILNK